MLVNEILSRHLRDSKAVARYAGLTGSPDESGKRRREKGLARAGNARVRRRMIQLAWRFLKFQKDSELAQWFRARAAERTSRHTQDDDRSVGAKAAHHALAHDDFGRDSRKRRDIAPCRVRRGETSIHLLGFAAGMPEPDPIRGGGRRSSTWTLCRCQRMEPPPWSLALDAHYCIMVRVLPAHRIQVRECDHSPPAGSPRN